MRQATWIAGAITLATAGLAIAHGEWNRGGASVGGVTLVLGREGTLVTGGPRNSGQSVRIWLGPDGATTMPVRTPSWMEAAGFSGTERTPTLRRALAVLDVGTAADPGDDGVTVVEVGRDPARLQARYPDRSRHLVVPVDIRGRQPAATGDTLGTLFLAVAELHVPGGMRAEGRVLVRTGRGGLPYIVR